VEGENFAAVAATEMLSEGTPGTFPFRGANQAGPTSPAILAGPLEIAGPWVARQNRWGRQTPGWLAEMAGHRWSQPYYLPYGNKQPLMLNPVPMR
jgi:hypothetical protein